nr:hypothetical protein Hi04_10k_c2220_00006 [uncultured bacterium]
MSLQRRGHPPRRAKATIRRLCSDQQAESQQESNGNEGLGEDERRRQAISNSSFPNLGPSVGRPIGSRKC